MVNQRLFVMAEIQELEELLAAVPEESVIGRMSLEARLKNAEALLTTLPETQEISKAHLTFKGRPVSGSRGIVAGFGTQAAKAFAEAYTEVFKSLQSNEGLRDKSSTTGKSGNQLLITGTAIGSFGFEFELPTEQQGLFPELQVSKEAMGKINTLFRTAAEGSDDDISEIIADIRPKAVKKLHQFLEILVKEEAWCGLEFGEEKFHYTDYQQLKNSSERLRDNNIQESLKSYHGEFQGVFPDARTFEFRLFDKKETIHGKFGADIKDPDILNREWLYKETTVEFNVVQAGQGRPKYTLMSLPESTSEPLL